MSKKLSIRIETERAALPDLTSAVEDFVRAEAWPDEIVFHILLALEEVVVNVMDYAHVAGDHKIEVALESDEAGLAIEVSDDGRSFNPLTDSPEPDLDAALEDRAIGGLGLHLTSTFMDEMRYRRDAGWNRLTLIKKRAQ